MEPSDVGILAIIVGNTRTSFGLFAGPEPISTRSQENTDAASIIDAISAAAGELGCGDAGVVVMASVNPALAGALEKAITHRTGRAVHRVGRDVIVPIPHTLGEGHTTGQDRALAAYAAFHALASACVVIDAGTAITVDFVDGEGTYQGGAILPGLSMMLGALHRGAALLPEVAPARPDDAEPIGKTTREAMLNGAFYGARGAVRLLAERYAERYGAYPRIIATGGDAELLFGDDDLIERITPDLVLRGVALATLASMGAEDSGEEPPALRSVDRG